VRGDGNTNRALVIDYGEPEEAMCGFPYPWVSRHELDCSGGLRIGRFAEMVDVMDGAPRSCGLCRCVAEPGTMCLKEEDGAKCQALETCNGDPNFISRDCVCKDGFLHCVTIECPQTI